MAGLATATTPRRQFVRTDFDGASNSSDYTEGVWDQSGNRIPAGVNIAPGTWVSVGGPSTITLAQAQQATGGGQFSIGNQNRLDQAYIDAAAAAALLGRDTLTANTANQNAQLGIQGRQLDLQGQQLTQNATQNAQRHEEVLAQLGLTSKQIEQDYQLNLQRFGIEQANLERQKKQDAAANALQLAQLGLSKDQINATIAGNKATATVDAMKWLAERQGPQDWTRQDYIENGMDGPTPTGSMSFSPLDAINEAYKPINTAMPDLNGGTATPPATGLLGGQGISEATLPPEPGMTRRPADGVRAPAEPAVWETMAPPGGRTVTATETIGGGAGSTASPPGLLGNQQAANPWSGMASPPAAGSGFGVTPPAGQRINPDGTVQRFAGGGTTDGAAIVGDSKSGKPTGAEEIAYARLGKDGKAELHVIPHSALGGLLDGISGGSQGTVHNAKKLPPELLAILPRAANGFGDGFNQPTGPRLAPMPSAPRIADENAGGAQDSPFQSFGTPQAATPVTPAAPGLLGGGIAAQPAAGRTTPANPGNYDPYKITVNKYSPDVMNNTPILRKLRGTFNGNIGFRGYGADGNFMGAVPSQGITNLPTQLNLRTLLRASPGEQKMLQGVYSNPESGLDWGNILAMAQAAAPKTASFGMARARA